MYKIHKIQLKKSSLKDNFSLLLEREEGERETSMPERSSIGASCRHPDQDPMQPKRGSNPQPRYVP